MRTKSKYWMMLSFLTLLLFLSCDDEEARKKRRALIKEAYLHKLALYKSTHAAKCREKVLAQAKIIADSTMLANARNIKVVDSLSRPPKPIKPGPPVPKKLEDSLEVAPLLPFEGGDTLIIE